jgi:hypothetical protein
MLFFEVPAASRIRDGAVCLSSSLALWLKPRHNESEPREPARMPKKFISEVLFPLLLKITPQKNSSHCLGHFKFVL